MIIRIKKSKITLELRYTLAYFISALYTLALFLNLSPAIVLVGLTFFCFYTVFISEKQLTKKNRYIRSCSELVKFRNSIVICSLIMIMSGVIYRIKMPGSYNVGAFVIDICAIMTLLSGLAFCDLDNEEIIEVSLFLLTFFACIIGVWALIKSNFRIISVSDRGNNVGQIQYSLWKLMEFWPFALIFLFFRYKEMSHRKKKLICAIICTIEYFVLSQLFMKRVIFFDAAVLAFVLMLVYREKKVKIIRIIVSCGIGILIIYFFIKVIFNYDLVQIINITLSRFQNQNLKDFDRFVEFINLFNQFGYSFIFTGRGFGSVQSGPGGVNLHIGILNYLFKGGVVFFLIMLNVFRKSVIVLTSSLNMNDKVYSACVVYTLMRSFMSPVWIPNPTRFFFAACIVMSLTKYHAVKSEKH